MLGFRRLTDDDGYNNNKFILSPKIPESSVDSHKEKKKTPLLGTINTENRLINCKPVNRPFVLLHLAWVVM